MGRAFIGTPFLRFGFELVLICLFVLGSITLMASSGKALELDMTHPR
jgi:hypothetical protein